MPDENATFNGTSCTRFSYSTILKDYRYRYSWFLNLTIDNKIELMDLEYMKSLIYLSHLWIRPNPCMEVGMSRLMLIFMLPHLQYLDGRIVTPEEIVSLSKLFGYQ